MGRRIFGDEWDRGGRVEAVEGITERRANFRAEYVSDGGVEYYAAPLKVALEVMRVDKADPYDAAHHRGPATRLCDVVAFNDVYLTNGDAASQGHAQTKARSEESIYGAEHNPRAVGAGVV